MEMMPKHIFWPIIDSSSLYATGVTRGQGAVLRRISGRVHSRSRDKDGGNKIRSAIAENRKLHGSIFYRTGVIANWFFLHCGNREFRVFWRTIMENIIFPIRVAKLMQMIPTHFLPIVDCSSCMLPELHAFKVLFYDKSVSVVTSGHVTQMAVTPFDPQCWKSLPIRKLHGAILPIADWSFTFQE